jgi:hypothetical protein
MVAAIVFSSAICRSVSAISTGSPSRPMRDLHYLWSDFGSSSFTHSIIGRRRRTTRRLPSPSLGVGEAVRQLIGKVLEEGVTCLDRQGGGGRHHAS